MVVIIDYGVGNIASIANMLKRVGAESRITNDPSEILNAQKIILCGVGGFDDGMSRLESSGIVSVIKEAALDKKIPLLGVCLGMQLLTNGSEEGNKQGLGLVKGFTRRFSFQGLENERQYKIPHMGWNEIDFSKPSKLQNEMPQPSRFYFVHSYHVMLDNKEDELMKANYGIEFSAAFEHNNIIGVQFHPEKSHSFGLKLYENFIKNY
jgi:imidazole glycerol-phosphate synthase subunit HisH